MKRQEFEAITRDHLLDDWGEKHYPPMAVAKLWRVVMDIAGGEYRQSLEALSLTAIRAPSLAQIRAACMPAIMRAREHVRSEAMKTLEPCVMCDTTGWIISLSRQNPLIEVAFICTFCTAAKIRGIGEGRGARFWAPELEAFYFPRRATDEGSQTALAMQRDAAAAHIVRRRGKAGLFVNEELLAAAKRFIASAAIGRIPTEVQD